MRCTAFYGEQRARSHLGTQEGYNGNKKNTKDYEQNISRKVKRLFGLILTK